MAPEAYRQMLDALRVTEGNIRSLGPTGSLDQVWPCYRVWLRVVQEAITEAKKHDPDPIPRRT